MGVLIVDDESLARQRLRKMVTELNYDVVAEAQNGKETLAAIELHDPAIVLLDIEMPGENGLEIANKIAVLDIPPAIIFTTAYDQYALKAFDALATGYLLKPIEKIKLDAVLEQAKKITRLQLTEPKQKVESRNHVAANGHRGVELIELENIRYFMADQKYVKINSTHGDVLIDETLKELETEFVRHFIRIHRNALVSIRHIKALERDNEGHFYIRLRGTDDKPMVSRRYTSKIKSLLKKL